MAIKPNAENLKGLGLMFGCPIYIETTDDKVFELASKHLDKMNEAYRKVALTNTKE